ncbi:MAG: response regulator [Gammaproteobacteria bacterium]|nr:response regulator [Gammaproteobacteria bacterium]
MVDSETTVPYNTNTLPGLRILIIDDDEFLCQELRLRLEDIGHTVGVARSGEEGLACVDSFGPQLVLVDWLMTGMDGLEVCRALRKSRLGQLLYIMMFTQHDNEDLLVNAFNAGADDFIPKPITTRVLLARVRAGERLIRLQEEVERERREAHRYLDIVDVIVLGLNTLGEITLLNGKGCNTLGYTERELLGSNWFHTVLPKNCREPIKALFDHAVSGNMNNLGYFETQLVTRTGEYRLIAWRNSVIYDEGTLSGFLFSGEDITQKRQVEQEREQLSQHLQQAQKMQAVGNLTGGIAHNFNNILASVIGYTELAQEALPDSGDKNLKLFLDNIHDAGMEARGLVETLMSFSRGDDGGRQAVLLPPVLDDVGRMLKPVLTASMQLRVQASESVPRVLVNPEHIHQMVTNLCINARDAMGNTGTIELSLLHQPMLSATCHSCHQHFESEFVELSINDHGSGISKEVISRMFEPFFTTKDVGKGTGLGLAMVHGTLHGYQGHILVESRLGEGTRIRLLFPVVRNE